MKLIHTNDSCSSYRVTGLDKRSFPKRVGADGPLLWDMQFVNSLKKFPVWDFFCDVKWQEDTGELLLSKIEKKRVGFDYKMDPVLKVRDLLAQSIPWPRDVEESRNSLKDAYDQFCKEWDRFRTKVTENEKSEEHFTLFASTFRLPQLTEKDKDCFFRYTNGDGSFRLFVVWGIN